MDLTAAAIATLISATTSAAVSLLIANRNNKKSIDDQLDALLKIAIQYPYLESEDFNNSWTSKFDKSNEQFLRYEIYATMVFNFLSRLSAFYGHKAEKVENHIAAKAWARQHAKYWRDPSTAYENVDTYDKNFVDLINDYLKGNS